MIGNNTRESFITHPYVWWDAAFSDEELARLEEYCDGAGTEPAFLVDSKDPTVVERIRISSTKFHHRSEETAWIFDRLNWTIEQINDRFYGFDLTGYDSFQYTVYDGRDSHYDWHTDAVMGRLPDYMRLPRKLSLTLMLSHPGLDFEGGEFQIDDGAVVTVPIPHRGRIIAFPSFVRHRVAPLTRGIRKSVVVWIEGPRFR